MKIELSGIELGRIGAPTPSTSAVWSRLELRFYDYDERKYYEVGLRVPVPKGAEVTWTDMQKAAQECAIEILKTSLNSLESFSFQQLEEIATRNKPKQDDSCFR